ncbi:hypothetical protein JXA80_11250 [bacterium]|nr:hypothetical protein [candidate division CSSED10-310 bacterium]
MGSMFIEKDVQILKERLKKLTPETRPNWGTFTAGQMLCHLGDAMAVALAEPKRGVQPLSGPPMIIRHMIRRYLPWPRHIRTLPEMIVTQPGEFQKDMIRVLTYMDTMLRTRRTDWPVHAFFGPLDDVAWARLTWRHINHHLHQFGL